MNTKDLIIAYYSAFNAADPEGMLALLTEDVMHDINQGERQRGKAVFRTFLSHMADCYREQVIDLVVMVSPDGQRAAAEFVIDGEYCHTDPGLPVAQGQRYTLPVGAFFEVQGEKISRVTNYYNLKDWTAQVSG